MTEQFSTSPTNHITAIARDTEVVLQARRAIDAAVMSGVTVDVVDPDERDDATIDPDEDGAAEGLLTGIRKILGDETPHLEHLADALEAGAHVVCVGLPDPDSVDDATHEDVKRRTATILREAGATAVTYHGRWGIENLAMPT
ncbi:MAG: hypothetical protein R6V28_12780 [Nitriliruptoraceae bacterium]